MVGCPHRHSGHEFEPTRRESGGQGSLVGCSPWGHKESDTTTEQQSVRCLQERMLQGQGGQGAVGSPVCMQRVGRTAGSGCSRARLRATVEGSPAWVQSGTDGRERMLQGQASGSQGAVGSPVWVQSGTDGRELLGETDSGAGSADKGGQGAVGSPAWAQSGTDGRERMLQGQALGNRGGEPCLGAERDGRQRAAR